MSEAFGILMLLPLLQGLDSGTTTANTGIGKVVFDTLSRLGWSGSMSVLLLVIALAFIVKGIILFGALSFNGYLLGQLLRELKGRLYADYIRMSFSYYSTRNTGHFINVINDQITLTLNAFRTLVQLGSQLVNAIILIGLAFVVSWAFGLMALVFGIALFLLFVRINMYVRQLSRDNSVENGHLAKLLIQTLHGFRYLVATGQAKKIHVAVTSSISRLTDNITCLRMADGFTNAIREPITVVLIILILFVQHIILGQPLAPIMVSILLFYRGLNAILSIQSDWQALLGQIGSVEMVRDEFAAQECHREPDGSQAIPPLSKGISFRNVYFRYNPAHPDVLQDINLVIPVCTSVALVGESGAGKSTIVDLLTMMLKPTKGQVLIDGVSGDRVRLASWREQIGYVSQEIVMFDDTIANNICMWEGDCAHDSALRARVRLAAQDAYIAEFIETLPEGYQTLVGDRGVRLSGGQRQRLFIARELFRKPNLLILDEATSALDTESEHAIQESIDALKGSKSVVIIAHRLSTIRNVDYVYVFDRGRLVEQGPYQELRNTENSRFSRLVDMQTL